MNRTKWLFSFLFFIVIVGCSYPQIRVEWDQDVTGQTLWYQVYYCAGDDTTLFEIRDGVRHDEVWDWQTGSTLYPYFYIKNDGWGKYYRVGVIGVTKDGDQSTMTCTTYERGTPIKPTNVKILEVKK